MTPSKRKIRPRAVRVQLHPPMPSHLPQANTVLATVLANVFEELGVNVALLVGTEWYPIHVTAERSVQDFEAERGVVHLRYRYNARCVAEAQRRRTPVVGTHAGYSDLFVPVGDSKHAWGVIVVGSFATVRPTAADLLARWHALGAAHATLTDPAFHDYVTSSLALLTLAGPSVDVFTRYLVCFSKLLGGTPEPERIGHEAAELRIRLAQARLAERTWEAARSFTDERAVLRWTNTDRNNDLAFLGLDGVPEHAMVGLLWNLDADADPLGDLVRRDALQRAMVMLARRLGGVTAGRVGDFGVSLLVEGRGSRSARQARLREIGERARALARRFGFRLHLGLGPVHGDAALPSRYFAALAAAERALAEGAPVVDAALPERSGSEVIAGLRRRMHRTAREAPNDLSTEFEQYFETVAAHTGFRTESMRPHLEAAMERVLEAVGEATSLDEKRRSEAFSTMDRAAADADTVRDLHHAYRALISDLVVALKNPTEARHAHGTRRALAYIGDHLGDPLPLAKVSRLAGLSPNYFSKLFKRREGVSFERYLRRLRVERAKSLLASTDLTIERIAVLVGFRTGSYLHRVFGADVGMRPGEFRRRSPVSQSTRATRSAQSSRRTRPGIVDVD